MVVVLAIVLAVAFLLAAGLLQRSLLRSPGRRLWRVTRRLPAIGYREDEPPSDDD
jgi:hypothetical protein